MSGSSRPATRRASRACRPSGSCRGWRIRRACIASGSSFYRVLREGGRTHRRGRARPPARTRPPASLEAKAPCGIWSRDITRLPGPVPGLVFRLGLTVDICSRKIVGREVRERESAELAARRLERAVRAEGCPTRPRILHGLSWRPHDGRDDEGRHGAPRPHCLLPRPRVSNDTSHRRGPVPAMQACPGSAGRGFASVEGARQ